MANTSTAKQHDVYHVHNIVKNYMQLFSILEKNVRKKVIASRVLITCISHVIIIKLYHAMGLINLVVSTIIPIKVQLSFHSNLRDVLGLHRIIQTTKKRVLPAAALIATHTTRFQRSEM